MPFISLMLCLILFCITGPVEAALPPQIHVQLFEAHQPIRTVEITGARATNTNLPKKFVVKATNGQVYGWKAQQKLFSTRDLVLTATDAKRGIQITLNNTNRRYPGRLHIQSLADNRLQLTNQVDLKTYVTIVVGSETSQNWPLEAQKAQAVLTQTRLAKLSHSSKQLMVGDSTNQEAYLGLDYWWPQTQSGVQAVWGQGLLYQNRPVNVYYHSACGGHTSLDNYFSAGQKPASPYSSAVGCSFCRISPFWKPHRSRIRKQSFTELFGQLQPSKTDSAGRVLQFVSKSPKKSVSAYQVWLSIGQRWGWGKLPGTRFTLGAVVDGELLLQSNGAGHGVGLCQWGAAGLAKQGKTYRQILRHYYPKTQLGTL